MKRSLIALVCLLAIPAAFAAGPRKDGIIHAKQPIRGQYIVVLGDRVPDAAAVADEVSHRNNAHLLHVYDKALKGFAIELPEPATNAGVIAGVNWVATNAIKPAVANMSLGGGASQALDDAVTGAVNAGVVFCVAAGNGDANGNAVDACTTSPARAAAAITVSATDSTDHKPVWANTGTCVDIFAPGLNITSSWFSSTTATNTISGTSMATPHTAGAAALYLAGNTTATPAAVASALTSNATAGVVKSPGTGSPNRLLYSGFIGGGGGTPAPTISSFS